MSFGSRRLALAIGARAVSFLGDLVATLALTLRLSSHGATAVAVLLACNLLPIVLLSDLAGRLADGLDERRVLTVTGLLQALVCAALVAAPGPGWIYPLVALLGAGQALNGAVWQAVIPALADPDRLAWALSRTQTAVTAAGVAAPALGGLLVGAAGTRAPLLVDVASFVLVAACGRAIGRVRAVPDPARDRAGGATIIARSPVLRGVVTLMIALLVVGCMVNVVEVFLVRSTLHGGAVAYGLAGAAYSVAALAGALWAGRFGTRARQARALVGGGVVIGAGLAGMGLAPSVPVLVLVSLVPGLANGVISVTASAVLMGSTAAHERGRVGAAVAGAYSGAQLASYGLAAVLSTALGPREVFVVAGLAGTAAALAGGSQLIAAVTGTRAARPPRPVDPAACARRALSLHRVGATR